MTRTDTVKIARKEQAVKPSRTYSSPLRDTQARETRQRMVASARALFLQQGYPATTVAAVARDAGVSLDTVYGVFGSKGALLKEVLDVVIAGDDEQVPVLERGDPQAMRAEPDQRTQLAMFAKGVTEQLEHVRPFDDILRSAAPVDPTAAELRADLQLVQRRQAMRTIVGWIAAHGPLRAGMSREQATDIVWTLTSPEVHLLLRDTCNWSPERYSAWLRDTLTAALLAP